MLPYLLRFRQRKAIILVVADSTCHQGLKTLTRI